jgi:2-polyprenyl-3-methyl-5-hydroxy-6-metoxy-1,4-benzoquinol methylase
LITAVTEQQQQTGERHPDWHDLYARVDPQNLPWYAEALDDDVGRALSAYVPAGAKLLDIGCGSGEQAVAMHKQGFDVLGVDVARSAVLKARNLAVLDRPLFDVGDVLRYRRRRGFTVAVDRGCFHVLDAADRSRYVDRVAELLKPDGTLIVKCFKATGADPGVGPWRFSWPELRDLFQNRFSWLELSDCTFAGPRAATPAAWLCVLRRHK